MSFIAAGIAAAATIGGSLISAGASGRAASTQAASADRAADLQQQQFERSVELQEPFRQAGILGQNQLMTYLGLGGGTPQYDETAYQKALRDYNANLAALDPSRFMVGGSQATYDTETGQGQPFSEGYFDREAYDLARGNISAPDREQFRLAGGNVTDPNFGKYATAEYTPAMFAKGIDPGYQFRLSEGLKALDRQAAARGGLISGSALKAATRYGQDMGSQEFMNAFNRYQTERTGTLNPLQSLAGVGQSATNQLVASGQNFANQTGEAYMGAANARASGYIGGANAINQGIGGITNQYYQNQLLNRVFPSQTQRLINQYGEGNVYGPGGGGIIPPVTNWSEGP